MYKSITFMLFSLMVFSKLLADANLTIQRKIFPEVFTVDQNITLVVEVNKGDIKGVAKIEETFPKTFQVEIIQALGAKVLIEEGKLRMVWLEIPDRANFTVSYRLINHQQVTGTFQIEGKLNYIKEEQKLVQAIAPTKFVVEKEEPKVVQKPTATPTPQSSSNHALPNLPTPQATQPVPKNQDEMIYKVQLGAFSKEKALKTFGDLPDVHFEKVSGLFKYYSGNFTDEQVARALVQKAKENGFPGAFLVTFKGNVRQ